MNLKRAGKWLITVVIGLIIMESEMPHEDGYKVLEAALYFCGVMLMAFGEDQYGRN